MNFISDIDLGLSLMKDVRQIWEETTNQLGKIYERREAENMAYLLLEDQFEVNKAAILLAETKDLDHRLLKDCIARLLDHEPLQYVTGVTEFFGRRFQVTPGALIPRPETEELVHLILSKNKKMNPKILDVGVGSGCIAITLSKELNCPAYGVDVSERALEIATINAEALGANVDFIYHDVLAQDLEFSSLDILVSNPPYIPEAEKAQMQPNVLDYEPESALFVPDHDPLIFYRTIGKHGLQALRTGGNLYFEVHEHYGKEVKHLLENQGYRNVELHRDMQGKDRIISAIS